VILVRRTGMTSPDLLWRSLTNPMIVTLVAGEVKELQL
jgi:hypothetical protein